MRPKGQDWLYVASNKLYYSHMAMQSSEGLPGGHMPKGREIFSSCTLTINQRVYPSIFLWFDRVTLFSVPFRSQVSPTIAKRITMMYNPSFLTSTSGVMIAALLAFARVDGSSLEYAQESLDLPPVPCCSASEMIPTKDELAKVDEVERISCDISMEDFHEKYEKARSPVVLVGCDKDWPAKSRWNYPDLFARFSRDSLWKAGVGPASGAPKWHDRTSWGDFVDSFKDDNSTAYLFDQLDNENGKLLEAEYEVPPQFRADLYKELKSRKDGYPKKFGSLRWWCLGKKGTGTMPHMDPAETDAWNTVIRYAFCIL